LNEAYFITNYHTAPPNQQVTLSNCVAERVDLSSSSAGGLSYVVSSSGTGGGAYLMGTVTIENCQAIFPRSLYQEGEALYVLGTHAVTALHVNGFKAVYQGLDDSHGGEHWINPVAVTQSGADMDLSLNNIEIDIQGARRSSAGTLFVTGMDIEGNVAMNLQNVVLDFNMTNMVAYTMTGIQIGYNPSTIHGTINGLIINHLVDDPHATGIKIMGTSTLTIDGQILVENSDFKGMLNARPTYIDSSQTKVILSGNSIS
jgi:hypothetical protein